MESREQCYLSHHGGSNTITLEISKKMERVKETQELLFLILGNYYLECSNSI
jgi:hypothetical protein